MPGTGLVPPCRARCSISAKVSAPANVPHSNASSTPASGQTTFRADSISCSGDGPDPLADGLVMSGVPRLCLIVPKPEKGRPPAYRARTLASRHTRAAVGLPSAD
jgi:hypothetical protein